MRNLRHPIWMLALLLAIAACSKDKEIDQPAKLTPVTATLRVARVWSASVDDKKAIPLRLGLGLAVDGDRVYAAGHKGEVSAFELASGKSAWHGRLFALDAGNGASRWSVRVSGEVLAPAAISEHLIALRTVDGKLHALSPAD